MQAWTLWLTGLPASGKTTVAVALRERLAGAGVPSILLDSDELREILTPEPDYTPAGRDRFYGALVGLAVLLNRNGANVIIAATAARRAYRDAARRKLHPFAEVWVRCPIEACEARDPKGLYARARAREIESLPGVGVPYEEPERPEAILDSDRLTVEESVSLLVREVPFLRAARENASHSDTDASGSQQ